MFNKIIAFNMLLLMLTYSCTKPINECAGLDQDLVNASFSGTLDYCKSDNLALGHQVKAFLRTELLPNDSVKIHFIADSFFIDTLIVEYPYIFNYGKDGGCALQMNDSGENRANYVERYEQFVFYIESLFCSDDFEYDRFVGRKI